MNLDKREVFKSLLAFGALAIAVPTAFAKEISTGIENMNPEEKK